MRISKIHLVNFKRFTDLLIDNIPNTTKLVVLIGSNGSGKSSLFDAFGFIDSAIKKDVGTNEEFWNYYSKKGELPVSVNLVYDKNKEFTVSNKNFNQPPLSNTKR